MSKQVAARFLPYTNARAVAKARHANEAFEEMTYAERRELCQTVFSGKTADSQRMGVWIKWSDDGKKWRYRVEGHLIDASGPINKDGYFFGAAPEQTRLVAKFASR